MHTLNVRERVLNQFIRTCEADAGSSGFGLPDAVSPAAPGLFTHDLRSGLFVQRHRRRTRRLCGISPQDLWQHIRVERDQTLPSASRSWYASSPIVRHVGSAAYVPATLDTPMVSLSRARRSPRATRCSRASCRASRAWERMVLPHVHAARQPATQPTDHHRRLPHRGTSARPLLQLIRRTMGLDLKTLGDHSPSFEPARPLHLGLRVAWARSRNAARGAWGPRL